MINMIGFFNPVFHEGVNVAVVRGAVEFPPVGKGILVIEATPGARPGINQSKVDEVIGVGRVVGVKHLAFYDLDRDDLVRYHDPKIKTSMDLFSYIVEHAPDFDEREIVTLLEFEYAANE